MKSRLEALRATYYGAGLIALTRQLNIRRAENKKGENK
jgi:hypothetical protein